MDSRSDRNVGAKRKTLCRNLNDRFLASDVKRIIFTDEEDFSVRERERELKITKTIAFMGNGNEIFIQLAFIMRVLDFQER